MPENIARVERTIDAPPQAVWQALTTPSILKQLFFGADVESNWKIGSPIRWRGEFKGKRYEDKDEILSFERERQLSVSHWSPLSNQPDTWRTTMW